MNQFRNFSAMIPSILLMASLLPSSVVATAVCDDDFANNVVDVRMQTDLGGLDITLRGDAAPITVANFCEYMIIGAYDGTFIHRNVADFVVQGGGFAYDPDAPSFFAGGAISAVNFGDIMNEADLFGALSNVRGTMAMAKSADPDSASNQWFFNQVDNEFLDAPNPDVPDDQNGFTVFAELAAEDLPILDDINAQDVCVDLASCAFIGGATNFANTIFIGAATARFLDPTKLLYINSVGVDGDGDGIIDRVEDAAPNTGDNNNDLMADSGQNNIASFAAGGNFTLGDPGEYVSIAVFNPVTLKSTDVLGFIFPFAHPPADACDTIGLEFNHNFFGFTLENVSVGGSTTAVVTLPPGEAPNAYFNYGPTEGNAEPHYYEFMFDGETGAVIVDNVVTLHFVDGKRGDSDLDDSNGVVINIGGAAIQQDTIVTPFVDLNGTSLTFETGTDAALNLIDTNFTDLIPPEGGVLDGLNFAHGFINFELDLCTVGIATTAILTLPEGEVPDSYFMLGPTPDNPEQHYYEFLYDGETGAEINGNVVTLHFVDGERGDSDLVANGVIADPGGPVFIAPNTLSSSGGAGGCSSVGQSNGEAAGVRVDFLLLLLLLLVLWTGHRRAKSGVS